MSSQPQTQRTYQTCILCEAMCGIVIEHDETQILSIKGDTEDPFSKGYICPKATALQDIHEDPDRLQQPLLKENGTWKTIDWQDAIDLCASRIKSIQKQYGNNAFATYLGNPNVHNLGSMLYVSSLLKTLGSKNRYSATSADQLPHMIVAHHLFGHQMQMPVPDIDHCDFMLMLGANPLASNGSIMSAPNIKQRIKKLVERGKIITVDPRRTETGKTASEHIFIKPGTDALLLLAMIHTLYQDNLVNPGKLAGFTSGLEDIESYCKAYAPSRVADLTGIPADTITRITHEFAQAKTAVCYGRVGVSTQAFGLLCQYLIMLLNLLTGRLDARGGMMFTQPAIDVLKLLGPGYLAPNGSRVSKLPSFSGERPVATLADEILTPGDDQVRGLVTIAGNPVLSTPNGKKLEHALSQLDFMVAIDFYLNESSCQADLVLPPVSPLERSHYDLLFHALAVRNTVKYHDPLFEAPANTQQDWQIFLALDKKLSGKTTLKHRLQAMGPERQVDLLLKTGRYGCLRGGQSIKHCKNHPHGVDLGALQPCLPDALTHKDKKIHLGTGFYFRDLERIEKQFFSQPVKDELLLIGRRHIRSNNSWLHNSHRLIKGKNRCTLHIHPSDAEKRSIRQEQLITVTSLTGSVSLPAEITDDIMPGVVSMPHGFGHHREGIGLSIASEHAGVSLNDLTGSNVDELSGNAVLSGIPVNVE